MKYLLSIAIVLSCAFLAQAKPEVKTLEIGAAAPDFDLEGVDGERYSLETFAEADYLVVVFTCNHCPDARAAWGRMSDFARAYEEKGVRVVAISSNSPAALMKWENGWSVYGDSFEEMKIVAVEKELPFPYLYDGEQQAAALAYGAQATPHVFLFGPERTLLYQGQFDNGQRNHGPAPRNTVRDTVDALLAGQPVERPTTRVFGCSTKWAFKSDWVAQKEAEWQQLDVTVEPIDVNAVRKLAENTTNKVRVINVWTTYCGPCIAEFPDLIETYRRFQARPFELITLSIDSAADADKVKAFLEEQHLPLSPRTQPSLQQENRTTNNYHYQGTDLEALAEALDAEWQGPIPHTIVVAPGGEVLFRHTGQIDPIELRRAIVRAIDGQ